VRYIDLSVQLLPHVFIKSLPFSVDFNAVGALRRLRVNLNEFYLATNLLMGMIMCRGILFVFCFSLLSVFYSISFHSIAFFLTRSDISADKCLFVPQYTAGSLSYSY